ncbi:hypothetical protein DL766_003037 [Monosporascus sp. MC13-8B]|nr:hypothetical protein DL763_002022 [Monosporascus cannonballus]RYP34388.1 hypothetical protein DL766_003037 [Monosporascus sp. MC13-8B]
MSSNQLRLRGQYPSSRMRSATTGANRTQHSPPSSHTSFIPGSSVPYVAPRVHQLTRRPALEGFDNDIRSARISRGFADAGANEFLATSNMVPSHRDSLELIRVSSNRSDLRQQETYQEQLRNPSPAPAPYGDGTHTLPERAAAMPRLQHAPHQPQPRVALRDLLHGRGDEDTTVVPPLPRTQGVGGDAPARGRTRKRLIDFLQPTVQEADQAPAQASKQTGYSTEYSCRQSPAREKEHAASYSRREPLVRQQADQAMAQSSQQPGHSTEYPHRRSPVHKATKYAAGYPHGEPIVRQQADTAGYIRYESPLRQPAKNTTGHLRRLSPVHKQEDITEYPRRRSPGRQPNSYATGHLRGESPVLQRGYTPGYSRPHQPMEHTAANPHPDSRMTTMTNFIEQSGAPPSQKPSLPARSKAKSKTRPPNIDVVAAERYAKLMDRKREIQWEHIPRSPEEARLLSAVMGDDNSSVYSSDLSTTFPDSAMISPLHIPTIASIQRQRDDAGMQRERDDILEDYSRWQQSQNGPNGSKAGAGGPARSQSKSEPPHPPPQQEDAKADPPMLNEPQEASETQGIPKAPTINEIQAARETEPYTPLTPWLEREGHVRKGTKTMVGDNGWLENAAIEGQKKSTPKKPGFIDSMKKWGRDFIERTEDFMSTGSRPTNNPRHVVQKARISLDPRAQSLLYCELEFEIRLALDTYIKAQLNMGRLNAAKLKRIADWWESKGRPRVTGFLYDLETQIDLVMAHAPDDFRFYGTPAAKGDAHVMGLLGAVKSDARTIRLRTCCLPDAIIIKHIIDIQRMMGLIDASADNHIQIAKCLKFFKDFVEKARAAEEQRQAAAAVVPHEFDFGGDADDYRRSCPEGQAEFFDPNQNSGPNETPDQTQAQGQTQNGNQNQQEFFDQSETHGQTRINDQARTQNQNQGQARALNQNGHHNRGQSQGQGVNNRHRGQGQAQFQQHQARVASRDVSKGAAEAERGSESRSSNPSESERRRFSGPILQPTVFKLEPGKWPYERR